MNIANCLAAKIPEEQCQVPQKLGKIRNQLDQIQLRIVNLTKEKNVATAKAQAAEAEKQKNIVTAQAQLAQAQALAQSGQSVAAAELVKQAEENIGKANTWEQDKAAYVELLTIIANEVAQLENKTTVILGSFGDVPPAGPTGPAGPAKPLPVVPLPAAPVPIASSSVAVPTLAKKVPTKAPVFNLPSLKKSAPAPPVKAAAGPIPKAPATTNF